MVTERSASRIPGWGSWLKSQIVARGLSQNEFAKKADVSKSTVSRWMGDYQPSGLFVDRIADVLVLDYDLVATRAGYRPKELLQVDPESAEARLLPYIRQIEWTDEAFEMIRRQLEFLSNIQRGEHDRS